MTMSRIQKLFTQNKAFVAYLTAGDGGIKRTLEAALALIEGGVNMLEIGVPFSDPIADGPVIQRAMRRALDSNVSLQDILWLIKELRKHSNIPLILFSYLNPILSAFKFNFLNAAKDAGIDGLLLVDCPLEESDFIRKQCIQENIDLIYLLSPTTDNARVKKIQQYAQGCLYYACRTGITGIRQTLPDDFEFKMREIKSITALPVMVGFGVSHKNMAQQILQHADGVVIGSLIVKMLEEGATMQTLTHFAKSIASCCKQ